MRAEAETVKPTGYRIRFYRTIVNGTGSVEQVQQYVMEAISRAAL